MNFKMDTANKNICSLCIFCLKSIDNSPVECDTSTKTDQYRFLTLIIRHFLNHEALISRDNQEWCRNACKVISEITLNGDDNEPFFENVHICKNCDGITRKFTDLYHQMKDLELRIDWEVSKLKNVMGYADKVLSRSEKDELEKTSTHGGVVTLGEFRNTLKQSCYAYQEIKKKVSVPKVQLVQMIVEESPLKDDVELDHNWEFIPSLFSPINLEECPSPILPKENKPEADNQHDNLQEATDQDEQQPKEPIATLQEEDPLNPPNPSRFTFTCSTCSLPFNSKFKLFQHNMTNHIGKYFLSVQHSEMSNDQFNHYIANQLKTIIDELEKVKDKYKCPFCFNLFSGRQAVRNHLVVKHHLILKDKLLQAQKSENIGTSTVENSISITKTTFKRKKGWPKGKSRKSKNLLSNLYCANCSLPFSDQSKLFQHNMSNHPEKYFVSVKLKFLTPHQFQNCVAHMLNTTVDEFQKVDSKYQCILCSQLISVRQYAKNHLVSKHRSVLKEKLTELQKSNNINLIMNTSRRTTIGRRLNGTNNEEMNHNCNICRKVFKKGFLLNQHQSYCHPEIFFETSNLLPSSSSSENDKQFKIIVRYILEKQIQVPVPNKMNQVKCGICSKIMRNRQLAKSHVIFRHRIFLAEKLEKVQQNEKLLEEIAETVSQTNRSKDQTDGTLFQRMKNNYDPNPTCHICGKRFKGGYLLNQHQSFYHPEIFFEDVKPTILQFDSEGGILFSKCIRFILGKQVDQEISKIKMATLTEGNPLEEPQRERDNVKYKCSFCSKALCSRKIGITHLVLRHRGNIAEMLGDLSGKSKEEIKLELVHFETRDPQTEVRNYKSTLTFDCSLCSKTFDSKFKLFQHDLCYHIEKYFLSAKPMFISNEQFKKCIVHTLQSSVESLEENNSKYRCSFCSKQLSGKQTIRYHLVAKHRPILKEKLLEMQKCESVLEKVESSISVSDISVKRKRGWPKGKRRLSKKPSVKVNFTSGNALLKTKRKRCRPRRVIDHVPVFRRQRIHKVSRCGGCGNKFANVYTLRTHLKGYCKVLRETNVQNLDTNVAKIEEEEEERMDDSKIVDQMENQNDE